MPKEIPILVLDAFTNGHTAALKFIKNKKLNENNIVFCKTHANIFKKLIKDEAYAIVPIKNSSVGEIHEVTKELIKYKNKGFNFEGIKTIVLPVNHYLLKNKESKTMDGIISHPKALEQCSVFIKSFKLKPEKIIKVDSTAKAAKMLLTKKYRDYGAIASKLASEKNSLKITEKNIQDNPDNTTTFIVLKS